MTNEFQKIILKISEIIIKKSEKQSLKIEF